MVLQSLMSANQKGRTQECIFSVHGDDAVIPTHNHVVILIVKGDGASDIGGNAAIVEF